MYAQFAFVIAQAERYDHIFVKSAFHIVHAKSQYLNQSARRHVALPSDFFIPLFFPKVQEMFFALLRSAFGYVFSPFL